MKASYAAFAALDPFFELVQRGLSGLVDGEHYFDTIAEHASFEFRYDFPGFPRQIVGRDALMALYLGYGDNIVLQRADSLVVHRCEDGRVVVLEYDVHGRVVANGGVWVGVGGAAYENRFASIVTIDNRKIVGWRDYMDSLSAMRALSAKI
jgi:ketosteroid isomerase-like protein